MTNCPHTSATGIDTSPDGPDKIWRCDGCGRLFRDVPDPDRPEMDIRIWLEAQRDS